MYNTINTGIIRCIWSTFNHLLDLETNIPKNILIFCYINNLKIGKYIFQELLFESPKASNNGQ